MYMHIHVSVYTQVFRKSKGWNQESYLYLERVSYWAWSSSIQLDWLAGELPWSSFLFPQHWDDTHTQVHLASVRVLGITFRPSCLHNKYFTNWDISHAPLSKRNLYHVYHVCVSVYLYLCVSVNLYVYVFVSTCALVPMEARRSHTFPATGIKMAVS